MSYESVMVEVTETPKSVKQGVAALWLSIAVCVAGTLVGKLGGYYSEGEFMFYVIAYAVLCIIPYKVSNGSNAARYWFAILFAVSNLFILGGIGEWKRIDLIMTLIVTPIDAFVLLKLFHRESNNWFTAVRHARG